jgi:D-3-phosphoglycerate dehydrogenase
VREGDQGFRYRSSTLELSGLRLGLLGFGRVAKLVAGYGAAFGMEVAAVSPRQPDTAFQAAGVTRLGSPAALFDWADAVSLHLPLTNETRSMVDAGLLSRLRPGALLINTGRGATVVESDLIAALRDGPLAGAGLDVLATDDLPSGHPLLSLPNVILSPHLAGSSTAAMRRMATEVAVGVIDVLAGRRPPSPVNPEVWDVGAT